MKRLRTNVGHRTLYAVSLMLWTGCGASLPSAPARSADGVDFTQVEIEEPSGLAEDPPQPLTLYPGDVLRVTTVSEETTIIDGLIVDETGRIHLPLAGDVEVGGLPIGTAEERVQSELQRFDRFVQATITLVDPAGHRASVLGAVTTPGQVRVTPGLRLADLIAAVGGPLSQATQGGSLEGQRSLANLAGARLYRNGDALPVSIEAAMRGDSRHNVRIRPGDHLYVPPRILSRVAVLGAVNNGNAYPHRPGMRLTEALSLAGGLTLEGDSDDIHIIRGDFSEPQVYATSLLEIRNGDSHDVVLEPGDVVFVTDTWIAEVGEVLDRLGPIFSTAVTVGLTTTTAIFLANP